MTTLSKFGSWAHSHRWIWSALAVLLFWGVLSTVTNRFSVASLSGIFLSASFLTVAGYRSDVRGDDRPRQHRPFDSLGPHA